jgi:hypothetical protein
MPETFELFHKGIWVWLVDQQVRLSGACSHWHAMSMTEKL